MAVLRATDITEERFRRLPFLITRAIVLEVTGLSDAELTAEIKAGRLDQWRGAASRKGKFYKQQVARIIWPGRA